MNKNKKRSLLQINNKPINLEKNLNSFMKNNSSKRNLKIKDKLVYQDAMKTHFKN